MWSIGVILYVLLVGYPPFADNNQSILFQKIRVGEYSFHDDEWKGISDDAMDLIKNLLVVDPLQRWTAKQALESAWLKKDSKALEGKDLTKSLEAIKRSKRKFKNVAKTIIMMKGSSLRANLMKAASSTSTAEVSDDAAEGAHEQEQPLVQEEFAEVADQEETG